MYSESASGKGQSVKWRLSIAASTETIFIYIYNALKCVTVLCCDMGTWTFRKRRR